MCDPRYDKKKLPPENSNARVEENNQENRFNPSNSSQTIPFHFVLEAPGRLYFLTLLENEIKNNIAILKELKIFFEKILDDTANPTESTVQPEAKKGRFEVTQKSSKLVKKNSSLCLCNRIISFLDRHQNLCIQQGANLDESLTLYRMRVEKLKQSLLSCMQQIEKSDSSLSQIEKIYKILELCEKRSKILYISLNKIDERTANSVERLTSSSSENEANIFDRNPIKCVEWVAKLDKNIVNSNDLVKKFDSLVFPNGVLLKLLGTDKKYFVSKMLPEFTDDEFEKKVNEKFGTSKDTNTKLIQILKNESLKNVLFVTTQINECFWDCFELRKKMQKKVKKRKDCTERFLLVLPEKNETFTEYFERIYSDISDIIRYIKIEAKIITPFSIFSKASFISISWSGGAPFIKSYPADFGIESDAKVGRGKMVTYKDYFDALQNYNSQKIAKVLLSYDDDAIINAFSRDGIFDDSDDEFKHAFRAAATFITTVYVAERWRKEGALTIFNCAMMIQLDDEKIKLNKSTLENFFDFIFDAKSGKAQVVRLNAVYRGIISDTILQIYYPYDYQVYQKMQKMNHDLIRLDSDPALIDSKNLKDTIRLFSLLFAFSKVPREIIMEELEIGFNTKKFEEILMKNLRYVLNTKASVMVIEDGYTKELDFGKFKNELGEIFIDVLNITFREEASESSNPSTIKEIFKNESVEKALRYALFRISINEIRKYNIKIQLLFGGAFDDAFTIMKKYFNDKPDVSKRMPPGKRRK